jgi:hypothetical protein
MKRFYFLLIFVIAVSISLQAQIKGGVKGGVNTGNIIISNKADYFQNDQFKARTSFHFGSYVQNTFSDHFAWQVEVLFSNKGYYLQTIEDKTAVSLNYINWPLLLVYKPTPKLGIEAGIELGLLVSGEELYNSFDMGIDFGANFEITKRINAGLRYNMGLPFQMDIETEDPGIEPPNYQHSVLQFYIGVNLINE